MVSSRVKDIVLASPFRGHAPHPCHARPQTGSGAKLDAYSGVALVIVVPMLRVFCFASGRFSLAHNQSWCLPRLFFACIAGYGFGSFSHFDHQKVFWNYKVIKRGFNRISRGGSLHCGSGRVRSTKALGEIGGARPCSPSHRLPRSPPQADCNPLGRGTQTFKNSAWRPAIILGSLPHTNTCMDPAHDASRLEPPCRFHRTQRASPACRGQLDEGEQRPFQNTGFHH